MKLICFLKFYDHIKFPTAVLKRDTLFTRPAKQIDLVKSEATFWAYYIKHGQLTDLIIIKKIHADIRLWDKKLCSLLSHQIHLEQIQKTPLTIQPLPPIGFYRRRLFESIVHN